MNIDRRVKVRFPLQVPVEYRRFRDGTYHSQTNDLSAQGMCLTSKMPCDVGRRCRFVLSLPHYQAKTEITGEVRWQTFQPAAGRMGIQFSEPIDLSIPLPAADEALRRWRHQTGTYFDHLYEKLSDACVWVNSRGEIVRHDERFLTLLGYSGVEVMGRPFYDFAHARDRERLSNLLAPETIGISSLTTGLFYMQPKEGQTVLWKTRVPPKPPWKTSIGIYIEDMTKFHAVKDDIYAQERREKLTHFPDILGAAATGFLIKDVLKGGHDSFTCLVARLDLLLHKLILRGKDLQAANGHELAYYGREIGKIEELIQDLTKKFRYMVENTHSLEPVESNYCDINECVSRAIVIVRMHEEFGDGTIRFDPQPGLPEIESNEQELGMIFLIFLLLSRHCLRTVSDKTVECQTREARSHIIATISHNGSVRQDKHLDIISCNDPIESYFFQTPSVSFMDTLLHYGNLLLKKNGIKTKINSVPGHFTLSLFIPFRITS